MTAFAHDLRLGLRLLLNSPGYSLVVVLTLALAIGANTVIFSITELLLLRPIPLGDPAHSVFLYTVDAQRGVTRGSTSMPDFLDWQAQATAFSQMAATTQVAYTLTGTDEPQRITAERATANLMSMWDLHAQLGRTFAPGEDQPGAPNVAVLSDRFWRAHYASDPRIVGRPLTLNGQPYTVVGVLTSDIEVGNLAQIDLWVPLTLDRSGTRRDERSLRVATLLKPDATLDRANAEIRTIAERLARQYPDTNAGRSARALKMRDAIVGNNTWVILALLTIVVAFVLLIACANVANMMLARAAARSREMAVRVALGASRTRLVRQLVSESLLLGVAGGAVGLVVAKGGLVAIAASVAQPVFHMLRLNSKVLSFAFGLSILAPILFSTIPALHSSRGDLNDALKEGGRRAAGGPKGRRSRAALIVSQLALAVMLLVVAGLVTRTIVALKDAPTGIDSTNVLTLQTNLDPPKYRDLLQVSAFVEQLRERLQTIPGVRAATAADALPLLAGEPPRRFRVEGRAPADPKDVPWANEVAVGVDYFRVFGVRIAAGRDFSAHDAAASPLVAVISREAARRYWAGVSPIGQELDLVGDSSADSVRVRIVGVAEDVKSSDLEEPAPPRLYRPLAQRPARAVSFALKIESDAAAAAPAVRATIRALDPDLAVSQVGLLDNALRDSFSENYLLVGMFASFALVALLLAAAGLYGVTAYSVSQRAQEIGIRMALGATSGDVLTLILRQNVALGALGGAVGVVGGMVLGRSMRGFLYSVGPADPATYGVVLAALTAVMIAATLVPARRATRVDPLECLRIE